MFVFLEDGICQMKGAIWRFPETNESTDILHLQKLADIDTIPYGADLKTIAYHPTDSKKVCSVVDNNFVLWDLASETPKVRSSRLHERTVSLKIFLRSGFLRYFCNSIIILRLIQVAVSGTLTGKGQPRFTNGKWNPHNGANQFVTLNENNVRGWDFRSPASEAWSILSAHSQIIR